MIIPPKQRNAHLASIWTAAICATMLAVGGYGATQPIIQVIETVSPVIDLGDDTIPMEEFEAPLPGPTSESPEEPAEPEPEFLEDVEIPPLPDVVAPLSPPEMVELTPLEELKPPPIPTPQKPKPQPQTKPREDRPKPRPGNTGRATGPPSSTPGAGAGNRPGSGPPTLFTGGGGGRFPRPSYPTAALRGRQQGTVRLLVIVEANGVPSTVSVQSSSGSGILDASARDHVRRRYRWPSGTMRRYIVPVRYVLP